MRMSGKLDRRAGPRVGTVIALPVNSIAPSISGTPTEGQTLTANDGTWTLSPVLTRQWLRNGSTISGATASTYVLVTADVGATITLRVIANGTVMATSIGVGPVAALGGGSTYDPALPIPTISYDVGYDPEADFPIEFILNRPPEVLPTDYIRLTVKATPANTTVLNVAVLSDPGPLTFPGLSAIASGSHSLETRVERGTTYGDNSNLLGHGPDNVAPVLTSPTGVKIDHDSATITVTTDTDEGTLYYLVNTSSTATLAAVEAGTSAAVVASGIQTFTVDSLTPSTTYYAHFSHTDATGNDSTVANSASFTTDAAPATAWSPLNKDSNLVLSGGNLTATGVGGGGFQGVTATKSVDPTTGSGTVSNTHVTDASPGASEFCLGLAFAAWTPSLYAKTNANAVKVNCGSWGWEIIRGTTTVAFDYTGGGTSGCGAGTVMSFVMTAGSIQFKRNGTNIGSATTCPTGTGNVSPFFQVVDASSATANFGSW